MHRLKMLSVLLSIALLSGVMLSAEQPVKADGDIESEFSMDENLSFVTPAPGANGTGEFELANAMKTQSHSTSDRS